MSKRLRIQEDFTPIVGQVVNITDSEGTQIQVTDAAKDNKALPKKILVTLEATHTGINRNKVSYAYDKLERSNDSWTANYHKPVLLNHDSWSDPLGRVKNSLFKQSVIDQQKHCIQLDLEITNADAIERFLDGRYKTFSIGGYTDSATCSICGKDQMTDGYCGHSRGKKYDGKECYWHLGQMDYDEISVVNCPADVHAQAISIQVVGEDDNDDGKGGSADGTQPNEGTVPVKDSTVPVKDGDGNILDNIDGILGNKDKTTEPAPQKDGDPETPPQKEGDATPPTADDPQGDGTETPTLEDQVKTLTDKVAELEATIVEKDATISSKDEEIATLKSSGENASKETNELKIEKSTLIEQNLNLAKFAHKTLASNVVDLQIALGEKKLEDKESLTSEYGTYTSKKLNDMLTELVKPEKIVQRTKVQSPGVVDNDNDNSENNNSEKTYSLDQAVQAMTGFIINKQI